MTRVGGGCTESCGNAKLADASGPLDSSWQACAVGQHADLQLVRTAEVVNTKDLQHNACKQHASRDIKQSGKVVGHTGMLELLVVAVRW